MRDLGAGEVGEPGSVGVQGTSGERGSQQLAGAGVLAFVKQEQGVLPNHVEQARVALTGVIHVHIACEHLSDVLGLARATTVTIDP